MHLMLNPVGRVLVLGRRYMKALCLKTGVSQPINSAGPLVVQSSVRKETFPSILIRQFYPLVLLSILLIAIVMMISHEAMKAIEILAEEEEQGKK